MNLAEQQEIFAGQVRGLQRLYPRAHAALIEWGLWSRDLAGMAPTLTRPGLWDLFIPDGLDEGHGNIEDAAGRVDAERKAEWDDERSPDEKLAIHVDELIHDGLGWTSRRPLLVVYVLNAPEYQYPRLASPRGRAWAPDDFLQYLEGGLSWLEKSLA